MELQLDLDIEQVQRDTQQQVFVDYECVESQKRLEQDRHAEQILDLMEQDSQNLEETSARSEGFTLHHSASDGGSGTPVRRGLG